MWIFYILCFININFKIINTGDYGEMGYLGKDGFVFSFEAWAPDKSFTIELMFVSPQAKNLYAKNTLANVYIDVLKVECFWNN